MVIYIAALILILAGLGAAAAQDVPAFMLGKPATPVHHPYGEGWRGVGHEDFHVFYQPLFNNKKRISCCHERDCRPTQSRSVNDHYEVMVDGKWQPITDEDIVRQQAPDGGAHVCTGDPTTMDPLGRMYCVVLPSEG